MSALDQKNNEESIEELVNCAVDGWCLDTVIEYAKDRLTEFYKTHPHLIEEERINLGLDED